MNSKHYLNTNVHDEAVKRISFVFDNFKKIYVSFSGGKDSSVLTHLVCEEARKRKLKIGVLFIDWECQFNITVEHVKNIYKEYEDVIVPFWIQLELTTNNSVSMLEPLWTAWDETKKDLWIREKESHTINKKTQIPFYYKGITFEEFCPLFAKWYSNNEPCANFVGLRSDESLNRYRTMVRQDKILFKDKNYSTLVVDNVFSFYPIYDWETADIWRYYGKFNKIYNKLYDYMYKAGMTIHQMRIDEPVGVEARKSLWLYQVIEPKVWSKLVYRLNGINAGSLYCKEKGNILGNGAVTLPKGLTYELFVNKILETMPKKLSEHYKNKIAKYIHWYKDKGYENGIPDLVDKTLEDYNKVPSWRLICKTLLRNDFYCKGIGFAVTKSSNYEKYMNLMRKKRQEWGLFDNTQIEEVLND